MGFFSWVLSDTGESLANRHSPRKTKAVKMLDDKGNSWLEHSYDGYGVFGGQDYYELLAEMNGIRGRDDGIHLAFSDKPCKKPKIVSIDCDKSWEDLPDSEICPNQGYFY